MKRQLTIVFFATIMMLVGAYFAQTASADDRGMRHGGRGMKGDGKMHEMMLREEHPTWRHLMALGLDEKQKAEVKEIRNRVMKETIQKRADERIAGIELKDLLDNDPVDMTAVQVKLKQIETLRTDIRLSHIRAREEVKSKLTPEQRKKFIEMCKMEPPMMGGRGMQRGMRHGGGMGMPPEQEEMR
ncbi:MAG: periplasmic heavy metal sensor [Nitrospiraceae bacterium]|nr:MAG: periplasmic heavy metal sensor [Nitrospiraceae bacterium]